METLTDNSQPLAIINQVESKIITLRNQKVLIDCDVAELYGVATKEVNQAVKNNLEKFPNGYLFELSEIEIVSSRSKFLTLKEGRGSNIKYPPKAFTEKGLYMLATILKSKRATETTIAIVEAFTKLRELNRTIAVLQNTTDEALLKVLLERYGNLLNELILNDVQKNTTESSAEINLGILKLRHTYKTEKGGK